MTEHDVYMVLERFGMQFDRAVDPDFSIINRGNAGGFSGALIWTLNVGTESYCLRRWPKPHPDVNRLQLIHRALFAANSAGIDCVPVPTRELTGNSFLQHDGHQWELTPWMPGDADYWEKPSLAKLTSAFQTLARFHSAVAGVEEPKASVAPAVTLRIQRLRKLISEELHLISNAVQTNRSELARQLHRDQTARRMLSIVSRHSNRVLRELIEFEATAVPLQICIRDIWHDHVLFTDQRVTGIVDFGACDVDTVATDIARLSGSMLGDNVELQQRAITAYEEIRPLDRVQRKLIPVLDQGTSLISGMNWLSWLFVENRRFEDLPAVFGRLRKILQRLEFLDKQKNLIV